MLAEMLRRTLENPWYPIVNRYGKPYKPNRQQLRFLLDRGLEAFFGGAAGPGKSEALLQCSIMFWDVPHYDSIIFRRTAQSLKLKGGLIPRSKEWWMGREDEWGQEPKWNGADLVWNFPLPEGQGYKDGPSVGFGYLRQEDDKFRYGSTEYQYIGFDEVTEIRQGDYNFMFSRARATRDITEIHNVPIRVRSAANPLGPGVAWVKSHFNLPEGHPERPFYPARLADNVENVDVDRYILSLNRLDPLTRKRLLEGDWTVQDPDRFFQRQWFVSQSHPVLTRLPRPCYGAVRYWDLAATVPRRGYDPDYTAGVLMTKDAMNEVYILDVRCFQAPPASVEDRILQCAVEDAARDDVERIEIWMEREPGSSGVNTIDHYARNVLAGYDFMGNRVTGSKENRARPFSSYAANGHVWLMQGAWHTPYLDELEAFPFGEHEDRVDASSGAFEKLMDLPTGDIQIEFGRRPR